MPKTRTLIVYYSRSGVTARTAIELANRLGADLEEIVDWTDRSGLSGYIRSIIDVLVGRPAPINPVKHDPSNYPLVVIATPVWGHRMAAPVRTWLCTYRTRLHRVAVVCTLGRNGAEAVFEELVRLSGKAPVASCKIDARDLREHTREQLLHVFADRLERKLAHVEAIEWAF